jgi:redox-sensitive bicupin YhaK (pirin superfamily)
VPEPTIVLRRAGQRFRTEAPGRITHHSFSFGAHYKPDNVSHASLLVCNDDRLAAGTGYPDHPHRGVEIVTWMLSGSMVHADSDGNRGVISRGEVQRMSAGSGVVHAERNDAYRISADFAPSPARLVQMWLRSDEPDAFPSYEQRELELDDLGCDWVPVVSGRDRQAVISLGSAGSTMWVTQLARGVTRILPEDDHVHLYVAGGGVELETVGKLEAGDSVRLSGRAPLKISGTSSAEILVWTMAS